MQAVRRFAAGKERMGVIDMPGGGMGGIGSLLGSLGGMGGGMGGGMAGGMGGGMAGGMGGMGGMGGFGGTNSGNAQAGQAADASSTEVYDVDRWKRADGIDDGQTAASVVQTVRDAWDQKEAKKKEKSLLKKVKRQNSKLGLKRKKKQEAAQLEEQMERRPAGTVKTNEMKRAVHNIEAVDQGAQQQAAPLPEMATMQRNAAAAGWRAVPDGGTGCFGLGIPARIDGFFVENPVNSLILAVDTLSWNGMALNQIAHPVSRDAAQPGAASAYISGAAAAGYAAAAQPGTASAYLSGAAAAGYAAAAQPGTASAYLSGAAPAGYAAAVQPGAAAGYAPDAPPSGRTATNYMDAVRESRERKKYDVHIVGGTSQ